MHRLHTRTAREIRNRARDALNTMQSAWGQRQPPLGLIDELRAGGVERRVCIQQVNRDLPVDTPALRLARTCRQDALPHLVG